MAPRLPRSSQRPAEESLSLFRAISAWCARLAVTSRSQAEAENSSLQRSSSVHDFQCNSPQWNIIDGATRQSCASGISGGCLYQPSDGLGSGRRYRRPAATTWVVSFELENADE